MPAKIVRGVPTEADVRRLIDAIGVPKIGDEITYKAICEVIKQTYPSARWWTVTNAWRMLLLRQHNICVAPHPDKEDDCQIFLALNDRQRLQRSIRGRRSGVRKVRRSHNLLASTARGMLPPEEQAVFDHEFDRQARIGLASRQVEFSPKPPKAIGG